MVLRIHLFLHQQVLFPMSISWWVKLSTFFNLDGLRSSYGRAHRVLSSNILTECICTNMGIQLLIKPMTDEHTRFQSSDLKGFELCPLTSYDVIKSLRLAYWRLPEVVAKALFSNVTASYRKCNFRTSLHCNDIIRHSKNSLHFIVFDPEMPKGWFNSFQ